MVFFRCTVGGSGKGNTVTVTCAEEFAGLTITLAKTGKTYTKTCPSTAPYTVTFYGVENGTYTVSCIVDGQTYSETVVVQDISCVLNYGFKWQTWVDTASQLDSSDYDSLDEVLADEKALRELFLEHACVDYMAEATSSNADLETIINDDYCAKWINNSDYALDFLGANTVIKALMDTADKYGYGEWVIIDDTTTPPTWAPKGNVPVMTANTAPYGVVSASTSYTASGQAPWKAFNPTLTGTHDGWASNTTGASATGWLQYEFVTPIYVKRFIIGPRTEAGYADSFPKKVKLQGSNDGTNFVDITEEYQTAQPSVYGFNAQSFDVTPTNAYKYIRVYCNSIWNTDRICINTLQFYGRELKVSVPTMTSNTAPFGEVIANTTASGYYAYAPFNPANSGTWYDGSTSQDTHFLGYVFTSPIKGAKAHIKITGISSTAISWDMKVQGSNGGIIWEDVSEVKTSPLIHQSSSSYSTDFDIDTENEAYQVYRVTFANRNAPTFYQSPKVNELQFYGLDYSEKEFEVGTTKKWLYDHGVELVSFTALKGSSTTTAKPINESNEIYIAPLSGTNNNANNFSDMATSEKINLTNYSLYRGILGSKMAFNTSGAVTACGSMFIWSTLPVDGGSYNDNYRLAYSQQTSPLGDKCSKAILDISSVNQEGYVSANAQFYNGRSISFTELWLE